MAKLKPSETLLPYKPTFVETFTETYPNNIHPMRITDTWDGCRWTVDLQVRTEAGEDIEATGVDRDFDIARNKAMRKLAKQHELYVTLGYNPT